MVSVGIGEGSHWVDGSSSSSVGSLGSHYSRGVSGDHGTIVVGDQGGGVVDHRNHSNRVDHTPGMVEGGLGSMDSWGVSRHHCSVRVSHQAAGGEGHAGRENQELHIGEEWDALVFKPNSPC